MDAQIITGAVVALVAAGLAIWGNLKVEDHKRGYEDRAYERQVLEHLQDATVNLDEHYLTMLVLWQKESVLTTDSTPEEVMTALSRANASVLRLRSRVVDDTVRISNQALTVQWREIQDKIYASEYNAEDWETYRWQLNRRLSVFMEKSGDLIRGIHSREPRWYRFSKGISRQRSKLTGARPNPRAGRSHRRATSVNPDENSPQASEVVSKSGRVTIVRARTRAPATRGATTARSEEKTLRST